MTVSSLYGMEVAALYESPPFVGRVFEAVMLAPSGSNLAELDLSWEALKADDGRSGQAGSALVFLR